MPHKYNLRNSQPPFDQDKFNELLSEIFPSKYMKDKVKKGSEESDSDTEYETDDSDYETETEESDDDDSDYTEESDPINVNITFTMGQEEESEEEMDVEKTEEFLEKVEKMGTELSVYKELPMYKKMLETHQEMAKKTKAAKEKSEKKEK
jgi:hypothetical protein